MNYTEKKSNLIQLKQNAAIIHWLVEAAENNVEADDISERLETIGDLAEQFAEDARVLAANIADPTRNTENKEAANA